MFSDYHMFAVGSDLLLREQKGTFVQSVRRVKSVQASVKSVMPFFRN
jgi:hypothetical protein